MGITEIRIHPAIGIAWLGNSPEYFIGPETRHEVTGAEVDYKDALGRIKKKAARFRLFAYDENGKPVQEITMADATIEWTVELANTKAAAPQFNGGGPRNKDVTGADRLYLEIRPSAQTLTGPDQCAALDDGYILFPENPKIDVPLGEIRTDSQGRLLVLGAAGKSGTPKCPPELADYADNDWWYDDSADGRVTAKVCLHGSAEELPVRGAWVLVGPPKFAPRLVHPVTLYDVLLDLGIKAGGLPKPGKPSLRDEIYPFLRRAGRIRWVTKIENPQVTHSWAEKYPLSASDRSHIFGRIGKPGESPDMPRLSGGTVTATQYTMMQRWKDGDFVDDYASPLPPSTPADLDRFALDDCVGIRLFPGIEAGVDIVDADLFDWTHGIRLDPAKVKPGQITSRLAIPWQADFYECKDEWWLANRPWSVRTEQNPLKPEKWDREVASMLAMVEGWKSRGFVVQKGTKFLEVGGPQPAAFEAEPGEPIAFVPAEDHPPSGPTAQI